jgi:hypothetical protein
LGGGGKRITGKMDENDLGHITRPEMKTTDELTHLPDEHVDSQNNEKKGIG